MSGPQQVQGVLSGFGVTVRDDRLHGLVRLAPTFLGYSMQGLFKVSLHKVFKTRYVELLGQEKASEWRTRLDLAASALAEFFTDVAPAPVEAGKLSFQVQPGFTRTLGLRPPGCPARRACGPTEVWCRCGGGRSPTP